jgi:foldase protein PrsA
MAKRKVKQEVPLTRKQVSRREKERRQRLIMLGIAAAIACLILAILGYGAYQELVAKPAAPVAKVNGVPIQKQTYQKRVLLERMQIDANIQNLQSQRTLYDPEEDAFMLSILEQQLSQLMMQRQLLGREDALNSLIDEELIRQAAEQRGIAVSPDEIDRLIEEGFGYYREQPTPVPSPSTGAITSTTEISPTEEREPVTRSQFEESYGEYLSMLQEGTGLSEAEYQDIVESLLLRQKMEESIGEQVSITELQIRARHILLETEDEAESVLERLEQGEDFEALAAELSQDNSNAESGGDLGWFTQGQMVDEFDEVAFGLSVGEISDVVETSFGFHIILLEERDENRELEPQMLDQRKREAFEVWLTDLRAEADIERYWSEGVVPPE